MSVDSYTKTLDVGSKGLRVSKDSTGEHFVQGSREGCRCPRLDRKDDVKQGNVDKKCLVGLIRRISLLV